MILRGSVFSKTLGMNTGITVVTPAGHSEGGPYQIAYVLHGLCGNHEDLVDYTMLPACADKHHCVFVLPEVGRSFYQDMRYGLDYFTYVAQELPAICRDLFRVSARREDTFVMGVSMGGYGALRCALTYPGQYSACCAISPGCLFLKDFLVEMGQRHRDEAFVAAWGEPFIRDFRAAFGEDFAWSPDIELLELAAKTGADAAPRLYSACGEQDALVELNRAFAAEARQLGLDYTYEEWPGDHNWTFFSRALEKAVAFCCRR